MIDSTGLGTPEALTNEEEELGRMLTEQYPEIARLLLAAADMTQMSYDQRKNQAFLLSLSDIAAEVLVQRMPRVHDLLAHKYYFDEIYDAMFVRPGAALGRFGRTVIESEFVQGVMIGGPTGVVRAGTNFARAIQNGYLRAYAGLLLFGLGGLVLYFLIVSS